jgi:hypothetical protein
MADETVTSTVPEVTVTSENKKDPKRVEAGKRLAVLSKAARERKKKEAETRESPKDDSMMSYIGIGIAVVSLWFAYKSHQRETKEPEIRYVPSTVEVTKKQDSTKLDSLE